jgi:fructose-bisphosphate aldolase class II
LAIAFINTMKPLKHYLQKAHQEHWAVGQFNFSDWAEVKAIVQAAQNLRAPIILGTSEGESKFIGLQEAVAMRDVLRKKIGLPIFLNLDHGKSFDYLKEAIAAGYDMVHFDGSKLPLDENIAISKQVIALAHKKGIVVEGEVGRIGTDASKIYEGKFEIKEEDLTKPGDAVAYLKSAKVDLLAVSVGTFHGMDVTGVSPHLKLDRLKELHMMLGMPLVLHGGSGTPDEDVREAMVLGISKININTELRLAFANALALALKDGEITPYKYLQAPMAAVQAVAEEKIGLFGSAGKA